MLQSQAFFSAELEAKGRRVVVGAGEGGEEEEEGQGEEREREEDALGLLSGSCR